MNKYWQHFKTITKHKHYVVKFCFKCGYYKRGLLHDLSKYGPTEFLSSARYFSGVRSPIDAEKEDKKYSLAWQHHKGHNPHHWEYWIDNVGTFPTAIEIPYEYVVEMICDWLAASIVYSKSKPDYKQGYSEPLKYYEAHKHERRIAPATDFLIQYFLEIIEQEGINYFCKFIRNNEAKMIKNMAAATKYIREKEKN